MPSCAIVTCKHRSDLINLHTDGITFHRFPNNPENKQKWISATGRGPVWWPVKRSTICSIHFNENQFRPLPKSRRLFDWAVPTLKLPHMSTTVSSNHDLASTSDHIEKPPEVLQLISSMVTDSDSKIVSKSSTVTCELQNMKLGKGKDIDVENGNCRALEKVFILTCSSVVKNINSTVDTRLRKDSDECDDINLLYEMAVFDEEIDVLVQDLTEFSAQTISYIAGFVVHALMKTSKCETCISCLLANNTSDPQYKFIELKDKGGLIYPCTDVITICKNMEVIIKSNVLSENKITVSTKKLKESLMSKALPRFIGMDLFKDHNFHQYDHAPMDNHLIMLTKAIMERYIKTRLHYLTKNAVPKLSKRQVLNKYLHFTGQ